ncbi:U6 snRNA-associated Sm-like protein LSm1 isoform X3 [Nycticebus coucang]|uniref:U6 snRNA-associated Sm-like protein LSm1 isoform X3 n=1 Tax=Nycticebus coucang TaxID=9470 RepID=UPI00234C71EE|nr:U6 snRNA-associated Sm-like protein LSm1 isoform X3 [Nycticebus coucang]
MSRDRTTSRPFLRTCTRSRKWVGMIWRSFRWALAVESRGRSAGPGRDSCPGPISAATGIRGRKFGTRWLTAALFQNELYARHRQPHRGHRQSQQWRPERKSGPGDCLPPAVLRRTS